MKEIYEEALVKFKRLIIYFQLRKEGKRRLGGRFCKGEEGRSGKVYNMGGVVENLMKGESVVESEKKHFCAPAWSSVEKHRPSAIRKSNQKK